MNSEINKTALVIDDDETLRMLLESMLERMGYSVLVAESGRQAIETADTYKNAIDVALLDLFLPDMRGDTICPRIKEHHPDLKIIVMSGYGLENTEVLTTEVHGFIQKPCTYEVLSETLDKIFL